MVDREELRKLLESDQALKIKLLDITAEGIAVHDLEGNYLYANDAACAMRGYTREELLQKNLHDLIAPGYGEAANKGLAEVQNTGRTELEIAQVRKDGSIVYMEINSSLVELGQNKLVMSVARDITERKRVESELKESEARFRNLTTHSPLGIFMSDINGQMQYVNSRICDLSGLTPIEISGMGWVNAVHPDDKERIKAIWGKVINGQQEFRTEFRFRKHDGTVYWIQAVVIPFKDESNTVIGYIGNLIDITDNIMANEKLRETQDDLLAIFDSSPAMIFYKDKNNVFVRVNRAFTEIMNLSREEIEGKPAAELFPVNAEKYWLDDMEVMNSGKPKFNIIERMETSFGLKWVRTDKIPYRDEKGNVAGIIGFTLDITEQHRAEEELRTNAAMFGTLAEGIFLVGLNDMVIKWANPVFERMFGYDPGEMIGEQVDVINASTDKTPAETRGSIVDILQRTGEWHGEIQNIKKDGTVFWCHANVSLCDHPQYGKVMVSAHTDITELKLAEEKIKESYAKLKKTLEGTIDALSMATETRDPYTAGHQKRVADLAYALALEMGLSEEERYWLRYAGLIHDIGKISVPLEILNKPGKLTDVEFTLIKMHSQIGYEIVKTIDFPKPIAEIVLQHHERINGSGYPRGINKDEMLIGSKIISVADVVEAMASDRPYRPALGIDKALDEISKNKGVLYDSQVVDVCLRLFNEKGFQFRKY